MTKDEKELMGALLDAIVDVRYYLKGMVEAQRLKRRRKSA